MSVPDPTEAVPDLPPPDPADVGAIGVAAAGLHGSGHRTHGPVHTHCENCGVALQGPFCHRCGQHDFPFHASFGHVFLEALENFLHFEGKFFRNVFTLLFRPGELSAAFNSGKRAAQMPPFRLYLFVSVLFFVTLVAGGTRSPVTPEPRAAADPTRMQGVTAVNSAQAAALEPARETTVPRARDRAKERAAARPTPGHGRVSPAGLTVGERLRGLFEPMVNESFREHVYEQFLHAAPRLLLVALPLFAFYTSLLFRAAGQVYLQHLVIALHYHTFIYLWLMVRAGWAGLASFASPTLASFIETAVTWSMVVYTVWMFRRLFTNSWLRTIVKTAVLTAAYSVTLAVIFMSGFVALLLLD